MVVAVGQATAIALAAECGDNFTDSDIFLSVGYLFRLGPQISDTKTTVVGTVMVEEWRSGGCWLTVGGDTGGKIAQQKLKNAPYLHGTSHTT